MILNKPKRPEKASKMEAGGKPFKSWYGSKSTQIFIQCRFCAVDGELLRLYLYVSPSSPLTTRRCDEGLATRRWIC